MANSKAEIGCDATKVSGGDYQVFLNFRRLDTRYGFTDLLYDGLVDAGVRVFRDDDELQVGEVIGDNLLKAINNSRIYIPIFSQSYASSKWCLRELAHVVDNESKSEGKKSILPIFYYVELEDVKLKTSLYSNALLEHKEKFPNEAEAWSEALAKVGKIKGWNVQKNQSPSSIVKSIVERVLKELETKQKFVTEHLVGHDQVEKLRELLYVNHGDVRLIGIYGMGGIGKTTIAKVIFNQLCSHFGKRCSFLEGVRERSRKEGIVQLQKKLLFDVVGSKSAEEVKDSEGGLRRIGETFPTQKVLVVLDDVDKKEHIMKLIGNSKLHPGTRIIITTRDISILQIEGFEGEIQPYEMLKIDDDLALQLFCRHAFGANFPQDVYRELSSRIVSRIGGLPLALEVIGSLLKGKDEAFWKETLARLKEEPEEEILNRLKISYDDLDKYHKQIFLDIACFLFNEKKTDATYMWADCQFYPIRGIQVLVEKCLIKVLDDDKFWMHDQLIDLGRLVVREESPCDLNKWSRLWIAEEALQIIKTEERKLEVQGLEICKPVEITNEDFERLPNLRLLDLNGGTYFGDFARCRSNLRWFSWHSPRDFTANKLYLDDLVVCKLNDIRFKDDSKAWSLIKNVGNLKVLSFSRCSGIATIPDISKCSGLERSTLEECSSLERIESFMENLQSSFELKIKDCMNLTYLPEEIGTLVKLKHFSLWRCDRLRKIPCSIGNLTSLTELNLSGTAIEEVPNSIGKLKSLRVLRIEDLKYMRRIPRTISMLHNLQILKLSYCDIHKVSELPTSLTCLLLKFVSSPLISNLSNLTNLVELILDGYNYSGEEPETLTGWNLSCIGGLSRLKRLELCVRNEVAPPELASLSHLEELVLYCLDLKPLLQLPSFNWSWKDLSTLEIGWCEVEDIPLERLPRLEKFTVRCCDRLQRKYIPLELRKLCEVRVEECPQLVEIQVMGPLKSLEQLVVGRCPSLTSISGLSYLKNLETLVTYVCDVLTNVEGLDELESLKFLAVWDCTSLSRLIDVSCTKIPDDCVVNILNCGDSIERSGWYVLLKHHREQVLRNISNKADNESRGGSESEVMEMSTEERLMDYRLYIEEEWARLFSDHDEEPESTYAGESESNATSFVDDFRSESGIADSFEAPRSRRQTRVTRIEHGSVGDVVRSSWQRCEGAEHCERSYKDMTNFEDQRDLSSISFTIRFHLGVEKSSEGSGFIARTTRDKVCVTPDSVTYEGLITDVKSFRFCLKRMWYVIPWTHCDSFIEIKSDEQVQGIVQLASDIGLIQLYVEGETEWEEYGWIELYPEGDCSDENSRLDEDSGSTFGGESETHGTLSVKDFKLRSSNAACFNTIRTIVEKGLDGVEKHTKLQGEPSDQEIAGAVTVFTTSPNFLAADRFSEAENVSEASRWSAEVDELERLLNEHA